MNPLQVQRGASGHASGLSRLHLDKQAEAAFERTPQGRKLRKAAGEFEAQLMSSLWKSMKSTFSDDDTDPASQSLQDYGMDMMCTAVGKAGGLGIGKLVIHALAAKSQAADDAPGVFQNGKGGSQ
ncbi:MAG TPA: hypothetical protein VMT51_05930 [Dongiaceae bacterium]|nr:hypothetical protein [Dongiaceae bacterium]